MGGRTVLGIIAGQRAGQRVEVALRQRGDGRLTVDLREQHHADGIGWFDQRTMELDPAQLRQLQGLLNLPQARGIVEEAEEAPRATIPFPGPSGRPSRRQAAGDEG